MTWNWQQPDWPHFRWDKAALEKREVDFLYAAGMLVGMVKHLGGEDADQLKVELISTEAVKTSEIEGEMLNRDSVQSSIRRQFGFEADKMRIPPAEQGIAEMMVDLYQSFDKPLTDAMLFSWHKMLTSNRNDIHDIGCYRTHEDPMEVVSGYMHKRKVHFEAPPSKQVANEMKEFCKWFNDSAKNLPALTRAGIAHLYFVSIHPFEDGNGRIARAISEKALAQGLGQPTLIALSYTIQRHRKEYYDALEAANKQNEVTTWLQYFSQTIIDAQHYTQARVEFLIAKVKLYDRLKDQLNTRQQKALERMFREGIDGFKGGLSADNYMKITNASATTATRDLHDLVEKGALSRTGERKHTRYHLNLAN